MTAILNLKKNDILNLTKKDPTLKNILVGCGWDVAKKSWFSMQKNYDLDLFAILLNDNEKRIKGNSIVYFANLEARGVVLHGDNLTGEGDGDDEKISISLDVLPRECTKIIFAVNIYDAENRKQTFRKVKNAYVRLVDKNTGNELARYNLSEDGGNNNAVIFAEIYKENYEWKFRAIGELLKGSIKTIAERYV